MSDHTIMIILVVKIFFVQLKVKEESEKVGFKLNIQKMKIMTSGPITSWEIDRETVSLHFKVCGNRLYFLGSKITADGDCSHEIIRSYYLEGKL